MLIWLFFSDAAGAYMVAAVLPDLREKDSQLLAQYTSQVENEHGKLVYKCSICQRMCERKNYMVIHVRMHTGEKPYKCRFCDYTCVQSSMLNVHERKHTGEKPHRCPVCGKAFSRKYGVKEHVMIVHKTNIYLTPPQTQAHGHEDFTH